MMMEYVSDNEYGVTIWDEGGNFAITVTYEHAGDIAKAIEQILQDKELNEPRPTN